jgi:hypothetical protein
MIASAGGVSREIELAQELGREVADKCILQVREYLNSPPDLMGNHLTAGRDIYITFLEQAATMANLDFSTAISHLRTAMYVLPEIAKALQVGKLVEAASGFASVATVEREASPYCSNA